MNIFKQIPRENKANVGPRAQNQLFPVVLGRPWIHPDPHPRGLTAAANKIPATLNPATRRQSQFPRGSVCKTHRTAHKPRTPDCPPPQPAHPAPTSQPVPQASRYSAQHSSPPPSATQPPLTAWQRGLSLSPGTPTHASLASLQQPPLRHVPRSAPPRQHGVRCTAHVATACLHIPPQNHSKLSQTRTRLAKFHLPTSTIFDNDNSC